MDNDIAVKVENVSKKYCKSLRRSMLYGISDIARNLIGLSSHPERLRKDEFWAVNDVSFELKKGETLGIIGPNGSGKTTLLKMINGIFWPDKGKIIVNGKVGALIQVGAGFHPSLTGRENIYINGAILGMSKKEIDKKLDEIIEFADIGDFIDVPVKFYSSGMFVRLGFSIAVHCEPDILLVDEILAVGDRNFQIKSFQKIHKLVENGISCILISHNVYAIREYTTKSIVLNKGILQFSGNSEDCITFYINQSQKMNQIKLSEKDIKTPNLQIIENVVFKNKNDIEINEIPTGESLKIDINYNTNIKIENPIIGINFYNSNGLCTGFWNSYKNIKLPPITGKGIIRINIEFFDLPVDTYRYGVVVCEKKESNVLEWKDLPQLLLVTRQNNTRGLLKLKTRWEIIK